MGALMELAFLIGGLLIGALGVLTIRNTLKLREKPVVDEQSDEQKERDRQFNALMDYRSGK
jgi:hypothetical protein